MENAIKKGCPFCTDVIEPDEDEMNLEIVEMEHHKFIKYYVKCNECESTGPMAASSAEAIVGWNARMMPDTYGKVSPKLDNIRESISDIEDKLQEIENCIEDD